MRILLIVLGGLLVISGVVINSLRGELQTERQKNSELQARLSQFRPPIQKPAGQLPHTESSASTGVGATAAPDATAAAPRGNSSDVGDVNTPDTTTRALLRARQDPEYREAERVQVRRYMMELLPGVAAELGLSRDEARRFYDLLADKSELREGPPDATLAALLGATRMARWEAYQQTALHRRETSSTVRLLAAAGLPLNAAQERGFIAAVVAERRRQDQETEPLVDRIPGASAAERARIVQQMDEIEDNAQLRIAEAAAPYLNAEQLAMLREDAEAYRTQQRVMRRVMSEEKRLQATSR